MPDFDPDGVPMLRITDMEHEFIDTSGLVTISTELSSQYSRTIVKEGDIVLSLVGTIGKAFEIGPKLVGVNLSRAIARIQLDSNTLPRYLCWIFQSRAFTHFIDLVCRGTAQRVLNLSDLNAFSFVFPTNVEQFAISAFLDHETARIDVLIEEQQRLIELLKEKRQAVISHAVTKGLDSTAPMKDSGVEWLGEVPAHWEIGGLTRFIGPVVDYRGRTPTKVDDGVFLVTARNIRNGRIDYEASEEYADPESAESLLARGRPEIGDLLFTMEAPLGQVALIDRTDIALAQRIVKFRGEPSIMRNHYLMFWLMSKTCQARLETLATGSTALGIKSSKLGMIECLAPTLNEQDAIVSHIQRESEQNDALVYEAANVIGLLQERRSALISAAVTGKIDVRGWQPPVGASSPELAQEAV
ncbi:restriction endonuclease subunit S [Pseudomonas chlororaphis]|uniref:restriction endonuclease subunit S n=1 Tax=Pseudomonas chlororaphis TaxID=587753 RepID=UPI0013DE5E2B|nr:restriction endonuclease subunit S [Pseudomonas chlororaphis]